MIWMLVILIMDDRYAILDFWILIENVNIIDYVDNLILIWMFKCIENLNCEIMQIFLLEIGRLYDEFVRIKSSLKWILITRHVGFKKKYSEERLCCLDSVWKISRINPLFIKDQSFYNSLLFKVASNWIFKDYLGIKPSTINPSRTVYFLKLQAIEFSKITLVLSHLKQIVSTLKLIINMHMHKNPAFEKLSKSNLLFSNGHEFLHVVHLGD